MLQNRNEVLNTIPRTIIKYSRKLRTQEIMMYFWSRNTTNENSLLCTFKQPSFPADVRTIVHPINAARTSMWEMICVDVQPDGTQWETGGGKGRRDYKISWTEPAETYFLAFSDCSYYDMSIRRLEAELNTHKTQVCIHKPSLRKSFNKGFPIKLLLCF